jgi:hypothetical protein
MRRWRTGADRRGRLQRESRDASGYTAEPDADPDQPSATDPDQPSAAGPHRRDAADGGRQGVRVDALVPRGNS